MTPKIVKVSVERDPDCSCPTEGDGQWSLYTFSERRNHLVTDVSRDRFYDDDEGAIHDDISEMLKAGLAFGVDYASHGPQTDYRLVTHPDLETIDGLVVWEHDADDMGAKTPEDRQKDAEGFLEEYTKWANGDCYGYSIEVLQSTTPEYDPDKSLNNGAYWVDADDSCWGLIGSDYATEEVKRALASYEGYRIVYRGDAKHIL